MRTILCLFSMLLSMSAFAQTTITGKVIDDNNNPIPGANIVVKGTATGAVTDFDGEFTLTTDQSPPFTVVVSSIGFASTEASVSSNNERIEVQLNEEETLLEEIVISASRTPERIFESPVTVERFGIKDIKNTASSDFYDGLENLKGVDINTNSLTFKSINTRGFATFANTRFMQLVDGMDNSSPALNFPLGNLLGMTDVDVQSIELLPGAASALYGANAFNGILFMRSKDPFTYQGLSGYVKTGITSQDAAGENDYIDFGIRAARAFSDKFALKLNFGYLRGTDWWADNQADKTGRGESRAALEANGIYNFDGTNIYGDEVATNIRAASGGLGIIPDIEVSRTGYAEKDLTNYNAESVKFDYALHYKPWANDLELIYQGKVGTGTTIYQGANRYSVKDFFQQQHKLEVRNDNFFVRGYLVADKAGNSYDMVFTGININRQWKSDQQWFGEYIGTYAAQTFAGATEAEAHAAARAVADTGRFEPGSPEFQSAFNRVTNDPDLTTGSKFQDQSKFYHADVNYNFSHITSEFADIQVGGSFRRYELNSEGTIYTDADGPISYSEFGAYTQIQKKLADERLKLTGSVRFDKSELFDGFFSPRLSVGYTAGENRNHNIRGSVQTGFRNPTTQDLYIGLDVGRAILIGSAEDNLDRDVRTYDVSSVAQLTLGQPATVDIAGRAAYENSFDAASVSNGTFQASSVDIVKPEQVTSYEVGYRGKFENFVVDLSAYYNQYTDFISNENVVVPLYGQVGDNSLSLAALQNGDFQVYQTYTNSDADINSYGGSVSVNAKVLGDFDLGLNYTYAKLDFDQASDPGFRPNFNTPEHKFKASFGNTDLFQNFGFNVAWRWSDAYFWQATFGDGDIPAYHVLDAQINLRVPKLKSTFKAGASNLLGDDYFTAFGTGFIGSQYYLSWTINNL
ncbi:TonB-dependent receptor [Sungkyunkwania multivorans]|uniref:TonB-dependent receptor n=1 Tax=Sungkyunkwania multivorans TaxID=1173618 RepID=A0ABW3D2K4_9FLAO